MIIFYFKEAFRTFKSAKLSSLFTIFTTAISILFILGSLASIFLVNKFSESYKSKIELNLFLEDSLSSQKVEEMRAQIEMDKAVASVNFVSKEDAAETFIKETGDDFKQILKDNPLPRSFIIKFDSEILSESTINGFIEEQRKKSGISDVVFNSGLGLKILSYLRSSQKFIYIFSIIIAIISVYLVYSTNKLIISANELKYETMKLVGAKLSSIKIPLHLRGIIIGFFAGSLVVGILLTAKYFLNYLDLNLNYNKFYEIIILLVFILGTFLGLLGSYLSTRNINLKIKKFH